MIKMKMIIAMIMVSLTALKKPKLLKTSRLSNCLSSNGTKSQIFRPRKDSNSVLW